MSADEAITLVCQRIADGPPLVDYVEKCVVCAEDVGMTEASRNAWQSQGGPYRVVCMPCFMKEAPPTTEIQPPTAGQIAEMRKLWEKRS